MTAIRMVPGFSLLASNERFSLLITGLCVVGTRNDPGLAILLMENAGFIVGRSGKRVFIALPEMWTLTLGLVTPTYNLHLLKDPVGEIRGEVFLSS